MDTLCTFSPAVRNRRNAPFVRAFLVAVPLALASTSFAVSEPSLINGQKKSFGYSWQDEIKLGAESDKEITASMGLYDNPSVQAYVDRVGQRVLQFSQFNDPAAPAIYRNTKFTFRVIDSPVVNAFALPGGYVYVTRGLLSHLQNEAQLAVVIGHEIAHIAARHSSQQARRSQWTQLGVIAGAILGQKVLGDRMPDLAPTLINAGGKAAEMFLLRYSREAEHESDTHGVNYAARAGYAAGESAKFFQSLKRLAAGEGKTLPTWQSSHPDPGDRAQRVVQIAATVPPEARANVGEEEFLKQIDGIVLGEDPRAGFARNGVFYHPGLRFQLPVAPGWKLDNQQSAVVMAEPSGKAMMGLKIAPGSRAREAATQFAQQSKIQVTSSGDTQVNGLPTTVIVGQGQTEQGVIGVWSAFIELEGKVYNVLGYAPQQGFEQVRSTFESVAGGFSPLRDHNLANVQPSRLKLVRVDRGAPFTSFVPTSLPQEVSAEEVAIMNQVALSEPVAAGRIIKIPDGGIVPQPAAPPPVAPRANSNYPAQNYPPAYPQSNPAYPPQPQNYPPPQQPQRYPQQQRGYPQQNPPQSNYPQQQQQYPQPQYPQQQYPQQQYPQQQTGYPTNNPQSYPQSGQTYPPANYPQYPQQPNQAHPQYPQSPEQPTGPQQPTQPRYPQRSTGPTSQNQPTVWPR